jgi:hypothetical protein
MSGGGDRRFIGFLVAGGGRGGRADVQLNTNDIKKLYCRGIRALLENMAYLTVLKVDRPYFRAEVQ